MTTSAQALAGLVAGIATGWLALIAFIEAIDLAAFWIPVAAIGGGLLLARRTDGWKTFGWAFTTGSAIALASLVALYLWLPGG